MPYNEPVKYTVHCCGYMVDGTDPDYKNYWSRNYQRREPGTYEQTEVFSYSATVSGYGAEVFEPFYLNYREIDYCILEGETNGIKFVIENVSKSPLPDCIIRENWSYKQCSDQDNCLAETDEFKNCREKQREVIQKNRNSCQIFIEEYDGDNTYSRNGTIISNEKGKWILTKEYRSCIEEAVKTEYNCSQYYEYVPCEDYCDPKGNPIMRDCSLYFTIPANYTGNITQTPENERKANKTPGVQEINDKDTDSLFTSLYRFLKLIEAWKTVV